MVFRNTLGSMLWMGIRATIMAAYLVALTRLLGPTDYGVLTAAIAVSSLFGPFTGLGLSPLIVLHGSRAHNNLAPCCGKFLAVWSGSIPILGLLVFVLWSRTLSDTLGWITMAPLAVSEVVVIPLLGGAYHVLQAKEVIVPAFQIDVSIAAMRLAAVLLLLLLGVDSITVFSWLYLMATCVGLGFALRLLRSHLDTLLVVTRPSFADLRDASAFLLLDLNSRASGALDKVFLLNLQGTHSVGVYSAGLRVSEAATLPFGALLRSTAPRLFRRQNGVDSGPRTSTKVVAAVTVGLGTLVAAAIYLLAPLLPVLLGPDWKESVGIMRWLAFLPLLYGLHHTLLTRVVGIASAGTRLQIELLGLAASIVLYATLIPHLGMLGAVVGQLGNHAIAIVLALVVLLHLRRRAPQNIAPADG